MGYNEGCIDRIYTGRGVTCVQNPVIGREARRAELTRTESPLKVVVVGGGPAGLEAARVAAATGHDVVLFERSGELGGQTLIAKRAPARQDFDGATRWSALQCKKSGVDIRLHTEANLELVMAESPDAVIVATDRHQGPGVAEYLLDRGKEVDLITSQETIATFLGATTRPPLLTRLFGKGGQIFPHLEAVKSGRPHARVAQHLDGRGVQSRFLLRVRLCVWRGATRSSERRFERARGEGGVDPRCFFASLPPARHPGGPQLRSRL